MLRMRRLPKERRYCSDDNKSLIELLPIDRQFRSVSVSSPVSFSTLQCVVVACVNCSFADACTAAEGLPDAGACPFKSVWCSTNLHDPWWMG